MEESRDREIVRNLESGKMEMTFWERAFGTHGRCARGCGRCGSLEDGEELIAKTGVASRDPAPEVIASPNTKFPPCGTP